MRYAIDDGPLKAELADKNLDSCLVDMLNRKVIEIAQLENPRSMGGAYRGKWMYVAGKYQIRAQIDDIAHIVHLLGFIRLP